MAGINANTNKRVAITTFDNPLIQLLNSMIGITLTQKKVIIHATISEELPTFLMECLRLNMIEKLNVQ